MPICEFTTKKMQTVNRLRLKIVFLGKKSMEIKELGKLL
jgi:hypothetical protein